MSSSGCAAGQVDAPRRRVERGEELVLHEHVRAGEFLEQAGFARVGVTDDGGVGHRRALALLALGGALAADLLQFGLDVVDALAHQPAVGFELAFALALAAQTAALLAAEVAPRPRQPGQGIFHAREFHLEPRFPRPGAPVENIQDDLLAVDHRQRR